LKLQASLEELSTDAALQLATEGAERARRAGFVASVDRRESLGLARPGSRSIGTACESGGTGIDHLLQLAASDVGRSRDRHVLANSTMVDTGQRQIRRRIRRKEGERGSSKGGAARDAGPARG
jgi:hypothetical protein